MSGCGDTHIFLEPLVEGDVCHCGSKFWDGSAMHDMTLSAFSEHPFCRKCRFDRIDYKYVAALERMVLTCSRCGYGWSTEPADKTTDRLRKARRALQEES